MKLQSCKSYRNFKGCWSFKILTKMLRCRSCRVARLVLKFKACCVYRPCIHVSLYQIKCAGGQTIKILCNMWMTVPTNNTDFYVLSNANFSSGKYLWYKIPIWGMKYRFPLFSSGILIQMMKVSRYYESLAMCVLTAGQNTSLNIYMSLSSRRNVRWPLSINRN